MLASILNFRKKPPEFRRDLWAAKIRCGDNGTNEFVIEKIFRSRESCHKYLQQRQPALGYTITRIIAHPAQFVVDAYLAYGNKIEN